MMLSRPAPCLQQVHRLESVAATPPADTKLSLSQDRDPRLPATLTGSGRPPVSNVDVYVDDFLFMAQTEHQRRKVMRATLNAIDEVLQPLVDSDFPPRSKR